jgi:hypothetical protein
MYLVHLLLPSSTTGMVSWAKIPSSVAEKAVKYFINTLNMQYVYIAHSFLCICSMVRIQFGSHFHYTEWKNLCNTCCLWPQPSHCTIHRWRMHGCICSRGRRHWHLERQSLGRQTCNFDIWHISHDTFFSIVTATFLCQYGDVTFSIRKYSACARRKTAAVV